VLIASTTGPTRAPSRNVTAKFAGEQVVSYAAPSEPWRAQVANGSDSASSTTLYSHSRGWIDIRHDGDIACDRWILLRFDTRVELIRKQKLT